MLFGFSVNRSCQQGLIITSVLWRVNIIVLLWYSDVLAKYANMGQRNMYIADTLAASCELQEFGFGCSEH